MFKHVLIKFLRSVSKRHRWTACKRRGVTDKLISKHKIWTPSFPTIIPQITPVIQRKRSFFPFFLSSNLWKPSMNSLLHFSRILYAIFVLSPKVLSPWLRCHDAPSHYRTWLKHFYRHLIRRPANTERWHWTKGVK